MAHASHCETENPRGGIAQWGTDPAAVNEISHGGGALPRGMWPLPFSVALDKSPIPQLARCLLQLGLRVHNDGPVPGDGFLKGLARHEQEAHAFLAGLHSDLVAAIEENKRTIADPLAD